MTKGKWSPIKEILFTYLAINKIMYWFYTVTAINQDGLRNVGQVVLMRLLNQDLLIILSVTGFYFFNKLLALKKSKYSSILEYVIFYVIGYVVLMGFVFIYSLTMGLIFAPQNFAWTVFVSDFISFLPTITLSYLVVAVALEIKLFFKQRGKGE